MADQQAKEANFLVLMDATEEYLSQAQQLSEALKKGMFHISQARYSFTGPLGQAQYHAEMEALTRVQVSEPCQFSTVTSLQPSLPAEASQKKKATGPPLGEGGDPLRWFGVLVPPALRSAQQDFLAGVQAAVQLAGARRKLQEAIQQAEQDGPQTAPS